MRKVISQIMVSLDGFIEGSNQELDWHVVNEEYFKYTEGLLSSVDTILFGRKTYQHMVDFWPTPIAAEKFPVIAEKMNQLSKVVFSKMLESVDWKDTRLINADISDAISELKQQDGMDMVILASSDLVFSLTEHKLIDEYHIIVNPVILGSGKPFFKELDQRIHLTLHKTKEFRSGNILLCYRPAEH
ncbi:dihydrofolate reductase family protein [Lentibacillus sediminis]|uniref:dihydrofolate reductase family protein n=1 Tax=Lentibacillus sediminis TaxID=1940529 RepID=UPI000C1C78A8|nr:dihydrofolate reductase family protein [Lentibacillus sediminis]